MNLIGLRVFYWKPRALLYFGNLVPFRSFTDPLWILTLSISLSSFHHFLAFPSSSSETVGLPASASCQLPVTSGFSTFPTPSWVVASWDSPMPWSGWAWSLAQPPGSEDLFHCWKTIGENPDMWCTDYIYIYTWIIIYDYDYLWLSLTIIIYDDLWYLNNI